MSELAQSLPPQEVIDQHETSRILSDAELIKMGAEIVGGVLSITPEQTEELAKEAPVESSRDVSVTENAAEPLAGLTSLENGEQDAVEQEIARLIENAPISLNTWLVARNIAPKYRTSSAQGGFTTLFSEHARTGAMMGLKLEAGQ